MLQNSEITAADSYAANITAHDAAQHISAGMNVNRNLSAYVRDYLRVSYDTARAQQLAAAFIKIENVRESSSPRFKVFKQLIERAHKDIFSVQDADGKPVLPATAPAPITVGVKLTKNGFGQKFPVAVAKEKIKKMADEAGISEAGKNWLKLHKALLAAVESGLPIPSDSAQTLLYAAAQKLEGEELEIAEDMASRFGVAENEA